MKYIKHFLSLKCAGDVLNVVHPVKETPKEISEAFATMLAFRRTVLHEPNKYNILDLCAGNALISVMSAFLLPVTHSVAVDKAKRNRRWNLARRFQYIEELNIHDSNVFDYIDNNTIIVSCHPCNTLAKRVVQIYNQSTAAGLVLMPCCNNSENVIKYFAKNTLIQEKLSKYEQWCVYLYSKVIPKHNQQVRMYIDNYCMSAKNVIISDVKC